MIARTGELSDAALASVRALLDGAFEGEFSDHDWAHALGGVHAIAWEDGEPVGHASAVPRRLWHRGRELRAGYVEGVAVRADRRRHGIGSALMDELEGALRASYELGALSATDAAATFYAARGWTRWRGPTSAHGPSGVVRTPEDDGGVFVLPVTAALDPGGELTCDWREGDLW